MPSHVCEFFLLPAMQRLRGGDSGVSGALLAGLGLPDLMPVDFLVMWRLGLNSCRSMAMGGFMATGKVSSARVARKVFLQPAAKSPVLRMAGLLFSVDHGLFRHVFLEPSCAYAISTRTPCRNVELQGLPMLSFLLRLVAKIFVDSVEKGFPVFFSSSAYEGRERQSSAAACP